jgi:DNA-binding SARP family transcriptional activator
MTTREHLRFRDLGPVEVEHAGVVRPVGGSRLEAALALLLIHADHPVGPDALSEAMWGEQGVSRSAGTLDSHVWRLRRLLEPDRVRGAAPTVLVREPGGYRLVVGAGAVDSARFAVLAAEAGELLAVGEADRALQRAEEAAGLWRGRPYGAAADQEWARAAVARLEEIRGRLREAHIGALLGVGAVDRALGNWRSHSPRSRCASSCGPTGWPPTATAAAASTRWPPTRRPAPCWSTSSGSSPGRSCAPCTPTCSATTRP